MEEITKHLRGRQVLAGDVRFGGLLDGDMVVPGGTTLDLQGIVNGDVIVEPGGTATIGGTVNGTVINNGGEVSIYGMVKSVSGTHPSYIHPDADVRS